MYLETLGEVWDSLGQCDPMWAILMDPNRLGNRWDASEFFATGQCEVLHILQAASALRFPLPRRRALDFGCGLGRLTQAMASYFDHVTGVDISPAMIDGARMYNPYGRRCEFVVNQHDDLAQLESNQYDFIVSLIVLQHMRPEFARNYIAEFVRVLAPGGLLYFQQPSRNRPPSQAIDECPPEYHRRRAQRKAMAERRRAINCWLPPWLHLGKNLDKLTVRRYAPLPPLERERRPMLRFDPPQAAESQPASVPSPHSRTELHTIASDEMLAYLKTLGARVLELESREDCGPEFSSFRYFVTK